jgi:predicted nucleotidyltransferase component of viral defense system
MLDKSIQSLVIETSETLELDPAIIEKDYYVTQALSILSDIQDDHSALVFAGGTCLAKAHRLVNRMSEDIDFKFRKNAGLEGLSKNAYLKTLKTFRDRIVSSLEKIPDMKIATSVRNEGQYLRVNLEYTPAFAPNLQLRPHLLVEFTSSSLRLPTQILPVNTLIQDTLGETVNLNSCLLTCISAEETAAEKWVGLTRRIAASERGYYQEDTTLVRHIYDLASINSAYPLSDNFFTVIQEVVLNDGKQFKNQYPEYFVDPLQEVQYSLNLLRNKPEWKKYYNDFLNTMVYAKEDVNHAYEQALDLLENLSAKIALTI